MNKKIERILAAVDFSEPSLNALDTAVSLAQKCDAELDIVHIKENMPELIGLGVTMSNSVTDNSSSILTAVSNEIDKKSGIACSIVEKNGHAVDEIIRCAIENESNLIIMGTYGASGYRKGYIGTTVYNVIKYAPCPVLIVPTGKKWTSFYAPLLPVRPVLTSMRHYDIIREFMPENSVLHILGLNTPEGDLSEKELMNSLSSIKEKLKADKITANVQWTFGNLMFQHIQEHIAKNSSDLIIITPAIDVSNKPFFIGPNAHPIISHARVPILVINKANVYTAAGARINPN